MRLALILGLALSAPAWGAIAIVQSGHASTAVGSGTPTISVTLGSPVTSGNAVVWSGICDGSTSSAFTSIADDKSDTYPAPDVNYIPATADGAVFIGHLTNITSGPVTLTLTGANCSWFLALQVYEVSGLASSPLDAATTPAKFASVTSPQSASYTTAAAGELAILSLNDSSGVITVGSPWTTDFGPNSANGALGHLLSPSSGANSVGVTFTGTHSFWLGIATYKAASGASTPIQGGFVISPSN